MTLLLLRRSRPDSPTDESLAQRLQNGDSTAFNTLFERYQIPLYRFFVRWTGRSEDSEDLVQETFLRVYASIRTYTPSRPFRPWLYAIARHLAWKRLKKQSAEPFVSLDDLPEAGDLLPDACPAPDELLSRLLDGEAIRHAVESLPEDQRMVFILYHYEGLPYEEIAQICDCPLGTVKSRMHYAVHALRRRLAHLREGVR
jgi:RNA polymerase sigma-70 factor, ECF subfamily